MTPITASEWAACRGRILTDRRAAIAHDLTAIRTGGAEPVIVRSPNQNPCAAGHTLVVVNGWLKCARCGAVLGKA